MDFITRFDAEPEFWQFLSRLKFDDVIAELVQNELDAEAKHTRISFGADSLVCEGDGKPIDDEGWARLSYIRGAGNLTPRKRFRIGVKNHGLNGLSCFRSRVGCILSRVCSRPDSSLRRLRQLRQ